MEDHRDLDPAPPGRGPAAAAAAPPETELGGPGPARGTARRDTESSPTRIAAAGHPGHDPSLAPRYRPPPPGHQVHAGQDRPACNPPGISRPWSSGSQARTPNGVPQDPRRAGRAGSQGRCVDRMGDPQGQRRRSCPATTDRADLAAVPAFSGRGDPGGRLLRGRPARRHPGSRAGRDRARGPAHRHRRRHPATRPGNGPRSEPATCSGTSADRQSG